MRDFIKKIIDRIRKTPGNDKCVDCGKPGKNKGVNGGRPSKRVDFGKPGKDKCVNCGKPGKDKCVDCGNPGKDRCVYCGRPGRVKRVDCGKPGNERLISASQVEIKVSLSTMQTFTMIANSKFGVQPHFFPWEKWKRIIWKDRETNTFPSLSIYFFPVGKNGKRHIFPMGKMGWIPPKFTTQVFNCYN